MNENAQRICDEHDTKCPECPIQKECQPHKDDTKGKWELRINNAADALSD